MLSAAEWDALKVFQEILQVCICFLRKVMFMLTVSFKVPHAFQQQLSYEKTPTLCDAIPSFEAMSAMWAQQQCDNPETAPIIENGLNKLQAYSDHADLVPAYVLAMSQCQSGIYL